MVKLLNPPSPHAGNPISKSDQRVHDLENRIHEEMEQLLMDIRRIPPTGEPFVSFGDLFDDDHVQQYYESLIGTLKSAKKRGCITFQGQMLLKGMSDNVKVSIVEQVNNNTNKLPKASPVPLKETRPTPFIVTVLPTNTTTTNNTNTSSNTNTTPVVDTSKTIKRRNQPRNLRMWTGSLRKDSVSQTKNHVPSQSACTDTEPEDTEEVYYGIGGWSDTDADPTIRKSPRRLILPLVFLQDCRATPSGRPPAPWKIRKAVSMSAVAIPQQSNILETTLMTTDTTTMTTTMTTDTTTETLTVEPKKIGLLTPEGVLQPRMSEIIPTRSMTLAKEELVVPVVEIPKQVVSLPVARCTVLSSSHMKSIDIGSMVDEEVVQLLLDIRRIGVNPGEPSVTFGELFDDDVVQNTYEALVGTLRSAKRQGKIHFQGQMLLKGMHDRVVISIVEDI